MEKNISFTLKVWRQNGPKAKGHFDSFEMKDIPADTFSTIVIEHKWFFTFFDELLVQDVEHFEE